MTTDFRALCAELSEFVARLTKHYYQPTELLTRARAALADEPAASEVVGSEWQPCVKLPITVHVREQRPGEQHVSTREGITPVQPDDLIMRGVAGEEYPIGRDLFQRTYRMGSADEPAVPEGREPVSVTGQPSDEELLDLHEWMADEWAANHDAELPPSQYARVVLARWGRPAPAPPADGEVAELVAWLEEEADGYACLGNTDAAATCNRAAELLQRQSLVPVAVSERPPGPEGLNDKGECWEWDSSSDAWVLLKPVGWTYRSGPWLPAHALPIPKQQETNNG